MDDANHTNGAQGSDQTEDSDRGEALANLATVRAPADTSQAPADVPLALEPRPPHRNPDHWLAELHLSKWGLLDAMT